MSIIVHLLNSIMNWLYSYVGDWGVVIIVLTLFIRACLLPLTIKQKKSMSQQQVISKKLEEIKLKYEGNKEKQQEEMAKISAANMKSMVGCLVTLLQIPIMYSLYKVFSQLSVDVGSIIVPWINNLKLPDAYHIVPFIAVLIQLLPNIIATYTPVKNARDNGLKWPQILVMGGISMVFFVKAPVTLGLYWITSGIFSILELLLYNRFFKQQTAAKAS
ncbi:MAG: hypothetical protein K0R50_1810 [Eubacterium sp.]|nr:hypothetical protein [Eubacterium sp.]